jgi:hypothetical protein
VKQISDMVLYAPLYQPDGDSFVSSDAFGHLCDAGNAFWKPLGREFPGANGSINCGSGEALDDIGTAGNFQFSTGAWIKPASLGQNSQGVIVDKTGSTITRGFKLRLGSASRVTFLAYAGGLSKQASSPDISLLNNWTFTVAVYNGANLVVYVNNVPSVGDALTGPLTDHVSDDFYIGNRSGNDRCFNGLIGEVMLFNRALAPQEIQNIYMETKWRYQ